MKRIITFALLLTLSLSVNLVFAQQPTTNQRLDQIDKKLDLILVHLGIQKGTDQDLSSNPQVKFGQPTCNGTVLVKHYYVICHENDWKIPEWVTYHLTAQDLTGTTRTNDFRPDPALQPDKRSELADYKNSGYDRGHQAPAGDFKRNKTAMSETFFLSNMAPQTANLNRISWEHLEEEVRTLTKKSGSIWIFTGPIFLDASGNPTQPANFIGNHVAVPTHFFKVILCEHPQQQYEMYAFIMPNQKAKLPGTSKDYIVSVDEVERLTGLDFFALLPEPMQKTLEAGKATVWPVQ
jgi:endonuclease G